MINISEEQLDTLRKIYLDENAGFRLKDGIEKVIEKNPEVVPAIIELLVKRSNLPEEIRKYERLLNEYTESVDQLNLNPLSTQNTYRGINRATNAIKDWGSVRSK
ncbi:hypothetical protein J4225_02125 [Candidatus Pacearchaeota archaeon]|nr:hypothetical protein [Candidatus Pacearchaeota archaeon]